MTMKQLTVRVRMLFILVGVVGVAAVVWMSAASANSRKPVVVPPDAVLTWNTNTVNAVRASTPTKLQTDGMVYMSYVQAAVAAASQTILDHYLPDQQPTVDAEYSAFVATLTGNVAGGVALGQAAPAEPARRRADGPGEPRPRGHRPAGGVDEGGPVTRLVREGEDVPGRRAVRHARAHGERVRFGALPGADTAFHQNLPAWA